MVKDRACVWIVFLMIGLLGLIGCSTVESPATVATMHTPVVVNQDQATATLAVNTVEALAPVVNATDAISDPVPAGVANPASVYCEEQGGRVELRDSEAGQYGMCIFADGECEEWAYYRGECAPKAPDSVVYCVRHGGHIEVRDSEAGQYNACVFDNGQECEAEAFLRSECGPTPLDATPAPVAP